MRAMRIAGNIEKALSFFIFILFFILPKDLLSTQHRVAKKFEGTPAAFVSLGSEDDTYGIVVEKKIGRLSIFKKNTGRYEFVKSYPVITGKSPGDKTAQGDNKTPEGIYFIVGEKTRADLEGMYGSLSKKYGPHAFILDYPNIYDRHNRKTGRGIWIHGVDHDDRMLKGVDTEGCVALYNHHVLELKPYITHFKTPVVIIDEMHQVPFERIVEQRKLALKMLDNWLHSWRTANHSIYESYYSKNFRSLGKDKNSWLKFKDLLHKLKQGDVDIRVSEPKILAFKDQLLLLFMQKYDSSLKKDFGKKFLYLSWEGDTYRIIGEKWYEEKEQPQFLSLLKKQVSDFNDDKEPVKDPTLHGKYLFAVLQNSHKEATAKPAQLVQNKPTDVIIKEEKKVPTSADLGFTSLTSSLSERLPSTVAIVQKGLNQDLFKHENITLDYDKEKKSLKLTYDLTKHSSKLKTTGQVCVVVITKDNENQITNSLSKVSHQGTNCVKGEFFRFGWLRHSQFEIKNIESAEKIKEIRIIYNLSKNH